MRYLPWITLLLGLLAGYVVRDLLAYRPTDDKPKGAWEAPEDERLYYYSANLVRVVDGDTVELDVDLGFDHWIHGQRFRLHGIDAPEMRGEERPEGEASKAWLEERLYGATVTVRSVKGEEEDSFGRWLAIIYADGKDVCAEMVEAGMAEEYRP